MIYFQVVLERNVYMCVCVCVHVDSIEKTVHKFRKIEQLVDPDSWYMNVYFFLFFFYRLKFSS